MRHLLLAVCLFAATAATALNVERQLRYCQRQTERTLVQLAPLDPTLTPRCILAGESRWLLRSTQTPEEWTAGFFPGILWMTGHEAQARAYTGALEYLAYRPVYDHDLGFIMIGSYLKGYERTHDPHYRAVLLAAADTLATLFNPRVGTLLSWPRNVEMFGGHNTIMDNMINLELLLWAAREGGRPDLEAMACSHADTTMRYHFRPDATVCHVAVYDPLTGRHLRNTNHQGLNDSSLWSRGQAWAIYGYTTMYRYTRQPRYLAFAQRVADALLPLLPRDGIPYWDMRDPLIPHALRDASAAAVIASALIDLSAYARRPDYMRTARRMLATLSSHRYQARQRAPAFLLHSVGNRPAGSEIDASINYADYYYIEALLKLKQL